MVRATAQAATSKELLIVSFCLLVGLNPVQKDRTRRLGGKVREFSALSGDRDPLT
jgi:hypothetical protein